MKWDEHSDLRIDALLDGELSEAEEAALMTDAAQDPALQAELDAALGLQGAFRSLPEPRPPVDPRDGILRRVRPVGDRMPQRRSRKLVPIASALAMIAVAFLLIVTDRSPAEDAGHYSDAEVAQALADVQWAFAYVSHMGERTSKIVREEAIVGRTIEPVRSVLNRSERAENNDNR